MSKIPHCCLPDRKKLGRTKIGLPVVVSGIFYLLIPKCPVCVAIYLAALTGVGISINSASWMLNSLLFICFALIAIPCFILLKPKFIYLWTKFRPAKH